ncbi:hypothetical protein [Flavobacterium sp.]
MEDGSGKMEAGRWEMGDGRWKREDGRWEMVIKERQKVLILISFK